MARNPDDMQQVPAAPAWGEYIKAARRRQGRSIRQIAGASDLSDSYWGQVERGYQTTPEGLREIRPSRQTLVVMAEALRLSSKETNELLNLAGERPLATTDGTAPRGSDVDLTDLSRNDIALLNAIADRFRATRTAAVEDEPPLRAVAARGSRKDSRTATELARAERRKQTGKQ